MNRKNINTSAYPEHSRVPGKLAKAAAVVGVSALALGAGFSAKYVEQKQKPQASLPMQQLNPEIILVPLQTVLEQ